MCVPHCCIASNIVDIKAKFSITEDDRIFNAAPLTFDPSIVEVQCMIHRHFQYMYHNFVIIIVSG